MKINTGKDFFDFGFELPEPEVKHLCRITEGVEMFVNEATGKRAFVVPFTILEGPSKGITFKHFCPVDTAFGEKQMCALLTVTGYADYFEKTFDDSTTFSDPEFVRQFSIKLTDKATCMIQGVIAKKDKGEYYEIKRMEAVPKKGPVAPTESAETEEKSDW